MIKTKVPLKIVFWKEVESPSKIQKKGKKEGKSEMKKMLRDIFWVISIFEVVMQFIKMRNLRIKKEKERALS